MRSCEPPSCHALQQRAIEAASSELSTPPGASCTAPPAALDVVERAHVASVHAGKTRSRAAADCQAWRVSPSPGERPLNELSRKHLARLDGKLQASTATLAAKTRDVSFGTGTTGLGLRNR